MRTRTAARVLGMALLAGVAAPTAVLAEEEAAPRLVVPEVEAAPVLDGRLDEGVWEDAATLPVAPRAVQDAATNEPRPLEADARLLLAGGRLWIGVRAAEPAGPGVGFSALVADPDTVGAADAVSLAFSPQDPRHARFRVRGPRGARRDVYRLQARAALDVAGRWSVEAAVPLEDLGLDGGDRPLRFALALTTRDPLVVTWAPPGAAFAAPDAWAVLRPPSAWPVGAVDLDRTALVAEDDADVVAVQAWRRFVAATQRSLEAIVSDAGRPDALEGEGNREAVRQATAAALLEPLDQVLAARPDLAVAHVQRAEVLAALGDDAAAEAALSSAWALVPELPEAGAMRALAIEGPALARGRPGGPTEYEGAVARARAALDAADDPFARDGATFGLGMLLARRGDADGAIAALERVAARYPSSAWVAGELRRARSLRALEARETQYRARDTDLPRLTFETSRGAVTVELYEDDHPNTVRNLVWLAEHGVFDGTTVDGTTPFFGVLLDGGDVGYALPTESTSTRRRAPLRGALVMAGAGPDTESAAVLLLTGAAPHLEGEFVVFGRVVEGQDVLERLEAGDAVGTARAANLRQGVNYRPDTVEGRPAPEPPQR